jgi:hypothetical protein
MQLGCPTVPSGEKSIKPLKIKGRIRLQTFDVNSKAAPTVA